MLQLKNYRGGGVHQAWKVSPLKTSSPNDFDLNHILRIVRPLLAFVISILLLNTFL